MLNVWQYDDQVFDFADGRLLLRGANGAGKSKTLEMLLPFVLDGDKAADDRVRASSHQPAVADDRRLRGPGPGRLPLGRVRPADRRRADRVVHLRRRDPRLGVARGQPRRGTSRVPARSATTCASRTTEARCPGSGCEEAVGARRALLRHGRAPTRSTWAGRCSASTPAQYDELLRLLYWLRQPQVGEDIEPARLADQLAQALPQLDDDAVRPAGDTFDELAAFGEQIERRAAAAEALSTLADAYATYARRSVAVRGRAVVEALREERRLRGVVRRREREVADLTDRRDSTESEVEQARRASEQDLGRIAELEASPEARDQRRLGDLAGIVEQQRQTAADAAARSERTAAAHERRRADHAMFTDDVADRVRGHARVVRDLDDRQRECATGSNVTPPTVLEVERLEHPDQAEVLAAALGRTADAMGETKVAVGHRRAAVAVVREALTPLERARRQQEASERAAEETERRWEEARERREAAQGDADVRAGTLAQELAAWKSHPAAPDVTVPLELTPPAVEVAPGTGPSRGRPGPDPAARGPAVRRQPRATTHTPRSSS